MQLSTLERKLVNGWQKGFPLVPEPYAAIAAELGITEVEVLTSLADLKDRGALSRVGAVVKPNTVGASTLVAMEVPLNRLEEVAAIVDDEPCVNHNYERENEINLWFVVTASSASELNDILTRIERKSGIETIRLPLECAYHIDLGFSL